jgi:hypothetical protein
VKLPLRPEQCSVWSDLRTKSRTSPVRECHGPRGRVVTVERGRLSLFRLVRKAAPGGAAFLCALTASGRDGSLPGGQRDSPAGSSRHSHKPDSRSQHSCRMDSYRRCSTAHSQFRNTLRTVRSRLDSYSRRSTRQRRNQQRLRRLRKLRPDTRGDMPVDGRLQRSRLFPVVLFGHQHCQGIASQSFATIEARRAPQPITRHHRQCRWRGSVIIASRRRSLTNSSWTLRPSDKTIRPAA